MSPSARLFNCARCRCQVVICRRCDRGNLYCGAGCADQARREAQRLAGHRYQAGRPGRLTHAARQRRYRERQRQPQKVTHQGSAPQTGGALLLCRTGGPVPASQRQAARPTPAQFHCHFCRRHAAPFLRLDFLRRRRDRPSCAATRSAV